MENNVEEVYKPYKRDVKIWGAVSEEQREVNGKTIMCLEIGHKDLIDKETGKKINEEYLYEDIYAHTIRGIFQTRTSYNVYMTISCEPKVVITYDGMLIMHNDRIEGYVEKIEASLKKIKPEYLVKALVDFTLNRVSEEKFSPDLRKLTQAVNKRNNSNFPVELVGFVLKQYYCEIKPQLNEDQQELRYNVSHEELLMKACEVLVDREKNTVDAEKEKDLLNELLYRLIEGKLVEKG